MYGGDDRLQPLRRGVQSLRRRRLQPMCGIGLQSMRQGGLQSVRGGFLQPVQSLRGRESLRDGLGISLVSLPGDAAFARPPTRERCFRILTGCGAG